MGPECVTFKQGEIQHETYLFSLLGNLASRTDIIVKIFTGTIDNQRWLYWTRQGGIENFWLVGPILGYFGVISKSSFEKVI